jgi:hypothetical protein
VILGKTLHHALERDKPGGSKDADLAHASTKPPPHLTSAIPELSGTAYDRASWRAESF